MKSNSAKTIDREGKIRFHDASLQIWEDSIPSANSTDGFKQRDEWEKTFKHQVFKRIVQQLNRLGWSVGTWDKAEQHKCISDAHRSCRKGDLEAELSVCGRCIEFNMWQDVTPSENRNGGRYDFNKVDRMPYLLRLEMHRTRAQIRDYLCNVFTGYTFSQPEVSSPNPDPLAYFNDKWDGAHEKNKGIHRFDRGPDGWPSDKELSSWSRTDKDGVRLSHGDVRWCRDHKGRLIRGRVYGGINGMWMMVYGPGQRDHTHQCAGSFFTYRPGETPYKVALDKNEQRKRLERELRTAVAQMNLKRAQVLKGILFPESDAPQQQTTSTKPTPAECFA